MQSGPRAALKRCRGLVGAGDGTEPSLVLVPSGLLREQVSAEILRVAAGGVALGVRVVTPWPLAGEVLMRAGIPVPEGGVLRSIALRRAALEVPRLAELVRGFEDGGGLLAQSLGDLLSAGLDLERLATALAAANGLEGEESSRLESILEAGVSAAERMTAWGVGGADALLSRASRALREGVKLPTRRVIVTGFADATGRLIEFFAALESHHEVTIILDWPTEIRGPESSARAPARSPTAIETFAARLAIPIEPPQPAPNPVSRTLVRAIDPASEHREIAQRVRKNLDGGATPERIGVVVNNPREAADLGAELSLVGVPWQGQDGPPATTAEGRASLAWLSLLVEGGESAASTWFAAGEALVEPGFGLVRARLARAFAERGATSLESLPNFEATALADADESLRLDLCLGGGGSGRFENESVSVEALRGEIAHMQAFLAATRESGDAPAPVWKQRFEQALAAHPAAAPDPVKTAIRDLGRLPSPEPRLSSSEVRVILERSILSQATPAGDTGGGGVRILNRSVAREATFDHLYLISLVDGSWPRQGSADPFLTDAMRGVLQPGLPGLHLHRERLAEERHQWLALLSAAPDIVLSYSERDEDNRPLRPSPWVEALTSAGALSETVSVPTGAMAYLERARQQHYALPIGALLGEVGRLRDRPLYESVRERLRPSICDGQRRALGRLIDPHLREHHLESARAHLGWVLATALPGSVAPAETLHVTDLEKYGSCGWRTFLAKRLRLGEARTTATLGERLDAAVVGTTAHRALELLAANPGSTKASELAIEAAITAAAQEATQKVGLIGPGYQRALALRVRPLIDEAVDLWADDDFPTVISVESLGQAQLGGATIRFRVDRVDDLKGRRRFVDYKTGSAPSGKPEKLIAKGEWLQAGVYAASEPGAIGEVQYLKRASRARQAKRLFVDPVSDGLLPALEATVRRLLAGRAHGVFFPRIEEPDGSGNLACNYCPYSAACVLGDSQRRGLLRDILSQPAEADPRTLDAAVLAVSQNIWHRGASPFEVEEDDA